VKKTTELPFMCVRDIVIFPGATMPLYIGRPATAGSLDRKEALQVMELFINAKPYLAMDEDAVWLGELKAAKRLARFAEILKSKLHYRKSAFEPNRHQLFSRPRKRDNATVNSWVALQQRILEAKSGRGEIDCIKKFLQFEIRRRAEMLA
jgi:ATP-dependent Lon protease